MTASHKNKKRIEACLADELLKASKNDPSSFAVAKKNDLERVAKAAR
jgi:small subunit ribosomal protein S7